jgi:polyisoprenoid-binding protein YceI
MATSETTRAHAEQLPIGDWQIDPSHSELGFLTHMFGLIPVRGRYSSYGGNLRLDAAGNASGELRIDAATIATGIKKRDAHLRSPDFFATDDYPQLRFELARLSADPDGSRTLTGTLQIRDQALPISIPVSLARIGPDRLRLDVEFGVNPRVCGFETKRLPGKARVQASLTLQPTS